MDIITQLQNDFNLSGNTTALQAAIDSTTVFTWSGCQSVLLELFRALPDTDIYRNELYPDYAQVRYFLDNITIRYNDHIKNEYPPEEWKRLRGVIGLKTVTLDGGFNIEECLKSLNDHVGTHFDYTACEQDCFTQLYQYLSNIPTKYNCFVEWLQKSGYNLPGMIEKYHNTADYIITENEKYNSIEIRFNHKPQTDIIQLLKSFKFRYNPHKYLWYGFMRRDILELALQNV